MRHLQWRNQEILGRVSAAVGLLGECGWKELGNGTYGKVVSVAIGLLGECGRRKLSAALLTRCVSSNRFTW